jgi:hypothetical protein
MLEKIGLGARSPRPSFEGSRAVDHISISVFTGFNVGQTCHWNALKFASW